MVFVKRYDEAKVRYERYGENAIPSPNKDCPKFLCCLLPCLDKTEAMIAYKACITDNAYVVRESEEVCLDAEALVIGDVVILKPGCIVPADVLLIDCTDNFCTSCFQNKSLILKGKKANNFEAKTIDNLGFAGCAVLRGQAKGIVVNVGEKTLMGSLINTKQWPLRQRARLMKTI